MRKIFFSLIAAFVVISGNAQVISNIRAEILADELYIYYDLENDDASIIYNISVYTSANEYSKPLKFVRGDVGVGVSSGKSKKVTWEYKKDGYNPMAGLDYKIKAITSSEMEKLKSDDIVLKTEYKAGKTISFSLNNKEIIANPIIQLYMGTVLVQKLEYKVNKKNTYKCYLPKIARKGKYRIKISSVKYTEIFLWSNMFLIK